MKRCFLLLLAIFFVTLSYYSTAQNKKIQFNRNDSIFVFNPKLNLNIKQKMLDSSFANNSTAPNFVVIIATNKLTGKTKEICTEAPFVEGGLERNTGNAKSQRYKSQYFYFNTKPALDNIGFNEYSYDDLIQYGQTKKIREIVKMVLKNDEEQEINFQGTRKEQFMFAHILFNNGILSTRGCIAGNLMTLRKAK
ncbi:MAG TPA: hypothetical protein VNX40_05890 [Mucilaginibacter sp.]|nr:hypothetical protein [Mucilaginibacter sp.]